MLFALIYTGEVDKQVKKIANKIISKYDTEGKLRELTFNTDKGSEMVNIPYGMEVLVISANKTGITNSAVISNIRGLKV